MTYPYPSRWARRTALAFGAGISTTSIIFAAGGWAQGILGYVGWALMPYAVLLIIHFSVLKLLTHPPIQQALAYAVVIFALAGPLLYIDILFVHSDAQGAIAMLMVPVIQTGFGLFTAAVCLVWQWHINRAGLLFHQAGGYSPINVLMKSMSQLIKPILPFIKKIFIVGCIGYILVIALQLTDAKAIDTAKEVDFYITQYCSAISQLPTSARLRERFPDLSTDNGWFYFTDDKTWLKVQYPVKWRNNSAIGMPQRSEFTATIYSYTLEYRCDTTR